MFGKHKRTRRQLEQGGKRAPATVVEIAATGWETESTGWNLPGLPSGEGKQIVRMTTLRVRPADEPEFELKQRIRYGLYGRMVPKAGDEIEVLFDPEDHEKVVVAPPTAEEEQARTMAALSKAKIGFGVDLSSGAGDQSSAEAMEQNQQAMDQAQQMLQQMNEMTSGAKKPEDDDSEDSER